ncbi:MAG: SMP-30/gluconolactonase/LRE family protein [Acidobacteria bacterium]|nr:SMP-30/gluconolactonase/LRE family protein [Acidobacteriota bacterium]
MQRRSFLTSLAAAQASAQTAPASEYVLGPDSQRHDGVPKGTVTQRQWTSKIYPGAVRDYWIYVPAQYDAASPACIMVFQDGGGWVKEDGAIRATVVLDNLIHKREIPVSIGVFINPGVLPAINENAQARYNRSFEYDALGDRYSRFLLEEILPEVARQHNISTDPSHRAIGGSSSGAICAFTVAWNRPDQFRRVLSWVGSYTNLRGGEIYPNLIRKTEPKPLRIFLQDGRNDLNVYSGSWYLANQSMASALEYAGYDVKFVVGSEAHNSKHGAAILPDALRWLWLDHPKPIEKSKGGTGERQFSRDIADPASDWEPVAEGQKFASGLAVDRNGAVYFADAAGNRIFRIPGPGAKPVLFKDDTGGGGGIAVGPDNRLYACQNGRRRVIAYTPDGAETTLAELVNSSAITVTAKNDVYFTDPQAKRVWLIDSKGKKHIVAERGLEFPTGIALSPDQSLLYVADYRDRWIWSYQIQADGSLANGEAFIRLETSDDANYSGAEALAVDSDGYVYATTRTGIQICDQPGRVVAIFNKPQTKPISGLVFAGPDLDWLYVTNRDKVFRRRVRRKGVVVWNPTKSPQPRL